MVGKDEDELTRLMRAAIAGNERAYGEVLHRAAGLVCGYVRRRTMQGGIDPEDVVQETLLAIHLSATPGGAIRPSRPGSTRLRVTS